MPETKMFSACQYHARQTSRAQLAALCISPAVTQCSHPFAIQHDSPPPQRKAMKIPSEPFRVTPSVCACLSANASSFLKLGPPVGLQMLLTAHTYASLLPNSASTGMRKEKKKSQKFSSTIFLPLGDIRGG